MEADHLKGNMENAAHPETIDYGKNYKYKMAALLSLHFLLSEVEDLRMSFNVKNTGDRSDIIFQLKMPSGHLVSLLLQFQHEDSPSFVMDEEDVSIFKTKVNNDLNQFLENKLSSDTAKSNELYFILFTNKCLNECQFLEKYSNLILKMLHTSDNKNEGTYRIKESYSEHNNLYILPNQTNIKNVNEKIAAAIKRLLKIQMKTKTIAENFISYITNWANGDVGGRGCISKQDVLFKLTDLILSQFEVNFAERAFTRYTSAKELIWNDTIAKKAITIVNSSESVKIFLIKYVGSEVVRYTKPPYSSWKDKLTPEQQAFVYGKNFKLRRSLIKHIGNSAEISLWDIYKYMWKAKILPLLLETDSLSNLHNIFNVLQLTNYSYRVVILTSQEIQFSRANCFQTLSDLDQKSQETILKQEVKLQGRVGTVLKNLIEEDAYSLITCTDIINIVSDNFNVGNWLNPLPKYFLNRTMVKTVLKFDVLQNYTTDLFVIVKFSKENQLASECLGLYRNKNLQDIDLDKKDDIFQVIIITKKSITYEQIERLKSANKPIHILSIYDQNYFELKWSHGSMVNIKHFQVDLKIDLEDNILQKECCDPFIIVSAPPGMGKTVLMDFLCHRISTNKWILRIDLNKHMSYFRRELEKKSVKSAHTYLKELYYLANNLTDAKNDLYFTIFQKFLNLKSVVVLFDGLDEVAFPYQNEVMNIIKIIKAELFPMWITTRKRLKLHIEQSSAISNFSLKPFTQQEQTEFLKKYFFENTNYISSTKKIFINEFVDTLLKSIKEKYHKNTEIPLQTRLLADAFTEECNNCLQRSEIPDFFDSCDVVDLYQSFLCNKFGQYFSEFGESAMNQFISLEENMYLLALKLVFPLELFPESRIMEKLNEYCKNETNRIELQRVGILTIDEQQNVSCIQGLFAEFLSAKWLSININSEREDIREIVHILIKERFSENYEFLFNIFDRILATNLDLHLAIINKDLSRIEDIIENDSNSVTVVDAGLRSPMHLLALYGFRHSITPHFDPTVNVDPMVSVINDIPTNIISAVGNKNDIMGYTPIDYALSYRAFGVADRLYKAINILNVNAYINLEFEAEYLGYTLHVYPNLFDTLLSYFINRRFLLNNIQKATKIEDYLKLNQCEECKCKYKDKNVGQLLATNHKYPKCYMDIHYATVLGSKNNVLKLLSIGLNANKPNVDECTPLHCAVTHGRTDIIKLLLNQKANVNLQNRDKNTPLHLTVLNYNTINQKFKILKQHSNIINLLLTNGSKIDMKNKDGDTPLHIASNLGYEDVVRLLILRNAAINIRNKLGNIPLHLSLRKHYDIAPCSMLNRYRNIPEILINSGANINMANQDGQTPLHIALVEGYKYVAGLLINRGADIDVENNFGDTPLYLSVDNGYENISELLINKGANINFVNKAGNTPLHLSIEKGYKNITNLLVNKGVNVNVLNQSSNTPLCVSVEKEYKDVVKLLLNKGANINLANQAGDTPLHLSIQKGYKKITKLLVDKKADVNLINRLNHTPLYASVLNQHADMVELFIEKGVNINLTNRCGNTPLLAAIWKENKKVTKLLIGKGASVNIANEFGETPLHFSVKNNYKDIVELLIDKGADLDLADQNGNTPLHVSIRFEYNDIAKLLINKDANINVVNQADETPLYIAIRNGCTDVVKLLINNGANLEVVNRHGEALLYSALENGYQDIARLLIKKGVNVNVINSYGNTPIFSAIENRFTDIVELLINNGANIDIVNDFGDTPLHLAIRREYKDVIKLLVDKGGDINILNEFGETPLYASIVNGYEDIATLLVDIGADVNLVNVAGDTSLNLSLQKGYENIAKYLLQKGGEGNLL